MYVHAYIIYILFIMNNLAVPDDEAIFLAAECLIQK